MAGTAETGRTLCLYQRKQLEISGVREVVSFDERGATILTEDGELSIEGTDIKISNLDTDSGRVSVGGRIDAMIYSADPTEKKKGFRRTLFG